MYTYYGQGMYTYYGQGNLIGVKYMYTWRDLRNVAGNFMMVCHPPTPGLSLSPTLPIC